MIWFNAFKSADKKIDNFFNMDYKLDRFTILMNPVFVNSNGEYLIIWGKPDTIHLSIYDVNDRVLCNVTPENFKKLSKSNCDKIIELMNSANDEIVVKTEK